VAVTRGRRIDHCCDLLPSCEQLPASAIA